MRPFIVSSLITLATCTTLQPAQEIFSNPPHDDGFRIPTPYESTVMARRILRLESIGTISTIFPSHKSSDEPSTSENRPSDVAGSPLGLMEYFADCEPTTGNPTLLEVAIANSYKNARAGSNVTLSFRWHPPTSYYKTPPYAAHSPAALPRVALTGYLERLDKDDIEANKVADCFTKYHPEARIWLPGNDIHESHFARLVVNEIYWFGGFGDRAHIGWLNPSDWKNISESEIDEIRLPGEKETSWWGWFGRWEL
ncbi:hypothetical protein NA57DRAFT_40288 [Rhizodiscina lignyota]|uniref:CREG-like beta-barrel domain-containing protein n=1 Tax=Rhizodiscina lignyota TaxID=1504668 RepID=A0A9P4IF49_9PEZI|nr:hypothetical protein NA57DRAFT_40288 [Rhizodiscina lignyota]